MNKAVEGREKATRVFTQEEIEALDNTQAVEFMKKQEEDKRKAADRVEREKQVKEEAKRKAQERELQIVKKRNEQGGLIWPFDTI
jgi:gamma-glutamyl:cysteine ligase YbdK (ATP-grasp superfamily)